MFSFEKMPNRVYLWKDYYTCHHGFYDVAFRPYYTAFARLKIVTPRNDVVSAFWNLSYGYFNEPAIYFCPCCHESIILQNETCCLSVIETYKAMAAHLHKCRIAKHAVREVELLPS